MKKKTVNKILQNTEKGYNLMAEKFSQTRKFPWRNLEFIEQYVKAGDDVLDFGCGNGRLLQIFKNKDIYYKGVDVSQELINYAQIENKNNKNDFIKISANKTRLPFNNENFNTVFSIATFHHLPGKKHRQHLAKELHRVTKKNGKIIITVWNLWQKRYRKNIYKNWFNKLIGKSDLDWNDCLIDFKNNEGAVFPRYHHAFNQSSLKQLFKKAGFVDIKVKKIGGNIFLIGEK